MTSGRPMRSARSQPLQSIAALTALLCPLLACSHANVTSDAGVDSSIDVRKVDAREVDVREAEVREADVREADVRGVDAQQHDAGHTRADASPPHVDSGRLAFDSGADVEASVGPPDGSGDGQGPLSPGQWLHVSGTSIVDPQGNPVRLFGVNRSGTEYQCVYNDGIFSGPADTSSINAITSWNANAVRILLNEDCWLGINGVRSAYGGAAYQAAIVTYVKLLLANGVYPIVDLHWTAPGTTLATGQQPMPDSDHSVDFWTSVATAFRGEANVILELFNEPYPDNNQDTDAAWTCWENGGDCPSIPYPVAGMQTLVTTVRATGAGNLLLLGGVDYSNALTQWVSHEPTDPLNNLAAAWHIYPDNACATEDCWNVAPQATAAAVPIVATEIGDNACNGTFPTGVMNWLDMQGQGQNYLAWTWDTFGTACTNYSLVTDYAGTPNGAYGMAFKSHFATVAQ